MFCEKCGSNISEDAVFCSSCGARVVKEETVKSDSVQAVNTSAPVAETAAVNEPVSQPAPQPTNAPAAPVMQTPVYVRAENPIVSHIRDYIKGFFSGKVTQTVGTAAKSTGLEWLVFALVNIVVFTISATLNVKYTLWFNGIVNAVVSSLISTWAILFANLFIGAASYFALSALIFGAVRLIFKKPVSYAAVMNMVGYATIPLTLALAVNIILGLIYVPLSIIVYSVGVIMTFCMLYIGIQKLDSLGKTPYFVFMGVVAVTVAIALLLTFLLYGAIIRNGVAYGASSLIDGMSDLGSMTGIF